MPNSLKFYLGQLSPTVGALDENARKVLEFYTEAHENGADYALLPELFLTGYLTRDLLFRPKFLDDVDAHLQKIVASCTHDTVLGLSAPYRDGDRLHIAYHYIARGKILHTVLKHNHPNYLLFHEKRYYTPGGGPRVFEHEARFGTAICEDIWTKSYVEDIARVGADILISPNGSPYARDKQKIRHDIVQYAAENTGAPVIYLNLVGLEDEFYFDGGSFVMNPDGEVVQQLSLFHEEKAMVVMEKTASGWRARKGENTPIPQNIEADYTVMVLAIREYFKKTGFSKAILGLSGGVDSALVAAIAVDALGAQNVHTFMLPSQHTSDESKNDAAECARLLGVELDTLSIEAPFEATVTALDPFFVGSGLGGVTEENIQPRLRALYLMALSNKLGALLLTTGNKSEVAVGYATLYGDMAGAFNPLKDMYKTRVYRVVAWRNQNHRDFMKGPSGRVIPENIITKAPTAELRPNQKDSDSLPEYAVLDSILEALVDHSRSLDEIIAMGHARETILKVQELVYRAEFKRFQAAPGVRLSRALFGADRQYTLINHWRDR